MKFYEILISSFIKEVVFEHSQSSFVCVLPATTFVQQRQNWVVVTEMVGPIEPKRFTPSGFQKRCTYP